MVCNIGAVYEKRSEFDIALEYYERSLRLREELGNKIGIATSYQSIGVVLSIQKKNDEALQYFLKALKIKEEAGAREGVTSLLNNVGNTYMEQKKYALAAEYSLKSLALAKELGSLMDMKEAEMVLSEIYLRNHDERNALLHYKAYIAARDSLINEETTKMSVRTEMNYEFDKKEAAAKLEQEKKEAVAAAESKKQKVIIWSVCGILLLVFAFAVFAYRSFLQKKKANEEITRQKSIIEEKQKEILDSIHYAKRIQQSLMPNEKFVDRKLRELNG